MKPFMAKNVSTASNPVGDEKRTEQQAKVAEHNGERRDAAQTIERFTAKYGGVRQHEKT
jgi:hypothetical protein